MKFKNKEKRTRIIAITCAAVVALGAVFSVIAFRNKANDDRIVIEPTFAVGALDEDGKFVEDKSSIYTKDAFECNELQVKLDFDATVSFKAFYYNHLDNFVGASDVYDSSTKFDVPFNASYARLVVMPKWNEDVAEEDRVCHWYDISKYSSQLEISIVKAGETKEVIDLIDIATLSYNDELGEYYVDEANKINIRGFDYAQLMVFVPEINGYLELQYYDESGAEIKTFDSVPNVGPGAYIFDIPENAYYVTFKLNCTEYEIPNFDVCMRTVR